MGEKQPRTTTATEASELKEKTPPTRTQLLVAEITDLVHATVPDRFPNKEDRVALDKAMDEFSAEYQSLQGGYFEGMRIKRSTYPRGEKKEDGIYEPESVLDEYFTIYIGDSLPYFVNNSGALYNGREFGDEEFDRVFSKVRAVAKSVEDGRVSVTIKKRDLEMDSPTIGRMVPKE